MKSLDERVIFIRKAIDEKEKEEKRGNRSQTYTIRGWRESNLSKPVIRLHVDYLMFRIENSRTFRQQIRYLKGYPDLPKTFFEDPESTEVQNAQEEILLDMINTSERGKAFIDDLDTRGQEDSAIITYDGYIVNGNRRTAALKSIGIEFIECVVLPEDATKRDIYALEHLLQISEDYKEDYHWVNELNNFYQGIHDSAINFDQKQMAISFRITKKELEIKLRSMELVNQFLYWKNIPKQYDYEKLDYAEEAFRSLEKATRKITNEHERQELMFAVFTLIEEPPIKGRLYSHVMSLIREWGDVYQRISLEKIKELNKKEVSSKDKKDKPAKDKDQNNLLKDIVDAGDEIEIDIFSKSEDADDLSTLLLETVADLKAEKKELSEAEAVYEGVSSSLRELQSLIVNESSAKLDATKNKLEQLILISNDLLKKVNDVLS